MEPIVDVVGLRVLRRGVPALDGVSLKAYPGQIILVAGSSGSGKSTLASAMCGLFAGSASAADDAFNPPATVVEGHIRVGGLDPLRSGPAKMARRVGLLFQNPSSQLFCLTVRAEAEAGPRCAGLGEDEISSRTGDAMEAAGVTHLASRRPWELSSGEQQRAALAAALAMRPAALVLDEPTSHLDDPSCERLSEKLRRLAADGACIIVMEHRWDRLGLKPDITLEMEAGRVVAERRAGAPPPPLQSCAPCPGRRVQGGPPLLEFSCESLARGSARVLGGTSVRIGPGQRLAVVGPNGSGKSTLARAIAGLEGSGRSSRRGSGRVMLVQSNAAVQLLEDTVGAEIGDAETAEALGLGGLLERPPTCLSVGQQMRVVIGAALASRPDVLILDDPSIGQDARSLARMLDCTDRALGDTGARVIMTHDARFAALGADEVYNVTDGAIGQ